MPIFSPGPILLRRVLPEKRGLEKKFWKNPSIKARGYNVVKPGTVSAMRSVPNNIQKPEYWQTGVPSALPAVIDIKNSSAINKITNSCQLASCLLKSLSLFIKPGLTTEEIDRHVHNMIIEAEAYPSPLNYKHFPKSICTSVNNVACHGIPDDRPLANGDIINVDITVYKDGYHGDCSGMFMVGNVDDKGCRLSEACLEALHAAIQICKPGQCFSAIGGKIENVAHLYGYEVIPCFTGHGIGKNFHELPDIYHFRNNGIEGTGVMKEGMTFTIEPVLGEGGKEIVILEDGWTAVTEDDSRTVQWEHTVLITKTGATVLTAY